MSDSLELTCLAAIRGARAQFFADVVAAAEGVAPDRRRDPDGGLMREYLGLIRSDAAAQVAEFLFTVEELGLNDARVFRRFIESHNDAMQGYLDAPATMRRRGLSRQRIEAAIFSEDQMHFIEATSPEGRLWLDQSSLGRLLTEAIAPETCRKVVLALAEGGLLERQTVGHALISSTGRLEALYRKHLTHIVSRIRSDTP